MSDSTTAKRPRSPSPNGDDAGSPPPGPPPPGTDGEEDDFGPMPELPEAGGGGNGGAGGGARKKRKVLPHEQLYLAHLPSADRYYKSFMHRDVVNFVTATKTDYLITTSGDGHLKLWKKMEQGIEFRKHYRAHMGPITGVSASADGALYATVGDDGGAKVFDVVNFDMINMLKLGYTPGAVCWVHGRGKAQSLLAISEKDTNTIRIYDGRGDSTPLHTLSSVHSKPVHLMSYSDRFDLVISSDTSGMVEYWRPSEPWDKPDDVPGLWEFKSSTDLYEFRKSKAPPTSLTLSPDSTHFVAFSIADRAIRVFNLLTGKLTRKYDESLEAISEMQQAGTAVYQLDDMEFGRRLALESEIAKSDAAVSTMNAVFDESGNFVIYPTLLGIKVVNIVTNKVARVLGKDETIRFLNVSLYQGAPAKKGLTTIAMAASANPLLQEKEARDPTLFCTAYKRQRFYLFSRTESDSENKAADRDVFNEKPTREEQTIAAAPVRAVRALGTQAILHTTKGDIHLRLFPEYAPKAVENFVGHAKSGYYEGIIFHRVIRKFMLQTGDPLGDGTGGESIWGHEFEDEFTPELKHDRPYTLSMANAGPKTNGSQFFITTVPTPWLDNRHTIFGRAVSGLDVVHDIEELRVDKNDKPLDPIKITSVSVE